MLHIPQRVKQPQECTHLADLGLSAAQLLIQCFIAFNSFHITYPAQGYCCC